MRLHRRLDDARRELEETLVEAPLEHRRALDEEHHLLEHAGGVAPTADRVEPLDDLAAALVLLRLDAGGSQHLDILVGARQLHLAARKAVAVRQVTRLQPGDLDLHRCLVELRAEPAHRPGEAQPILLPDHRLAERQAVDDGGELLGQGLRDRTPGHDHAEKAVARLELVLGDALLAGKPGSGLLPQVLGRAPEPSGRPHARRPRSPAGPTGAARRTRCPPRARAASARGAAPRPRGTQRPAAPRSRSQTAGSARAST